MYDTDLPDKCKPVLSDANSDICWVKPLEWNSISTCRCVFNALDNSCQVIRHVSFKKYSFISSHWSQNRKYGMALIEQNMSFLPLVSGPFISLKKRDVSIQCVLINSCDVQSQPILFLCSSCTLVNRIHFSERSSRRLNKGKCLHFSHDSGVASVCWPMETVALLKGCCSVKPVKGTENFSSQQLSLLFFVGVFFLSRFQAAIKCTPLAWVVGRITSQTILGEFQWREEEEWVREAAIKADVDWGLLGLGKAKLLCLFLLLINISVTFLIIFYPCFLASSIYKVSGLLESQGELC